MQKSGKEKAVEDVLLGRVGQSIRAEDVKRIGDTLRKVLCLEKKAALPIRRVLLRVLGRRLTREDVSDISAILSLGEERLLKDLPFGELFAANETVDIRCEGISLCGEAVIMKVRILTGAMVNEVRYHRCSPTFLQRLGRIIGLNGRRRRDYHPREFFGMEFTADIKRDKMTTKITDFDVTDLQKGRNARLKILRKSRKPSCALSARCHYCPEGTDTCRRATHEKEWTDGTCKQGHEAFFDATGCLFCQEKEYKRHARIVTFEPAD